MSSAEGSFDGSYSGDVDTGTGVDSSSPADSAPPVAIDSTAQDQQSVNPAWQPVFDKLPQEFHNMVKPTFETWDKNYQSLQEKYRPWEQLGQPYDVVERNLGVVQQLNDNPQAFYEKLGQLIGVTPNQAAGLAQQQNQQTPQDTPDEDTYDLSDPELAKLRQTVEAMQQQQQQWQQEREAITQKAQVAEYEKKAQDHIDRLAASHAQQYPGIPFDPSEVVRRVLLQTYQNPESEPDIDGAYREYIDLATRVRNAPRPGNSAPYVINPNGGGMPPSDAINPATATPEQRKAMVAQMLAARQQQP